MPLSAKRRENLVRTLRPRSVAFVGGAFLDSAVGLCAKLGFEGPVWPVNPKYATLGGRPCFASVADLPEPPDATFVAVPREATIDVVRDLARMGGGGAICYAAGYAEVGGDGPRLQEELVAAAGDLALVGPNCYGLLNLVDGVSMFPIGHGASRVARGAALIAQSGNLSLNVTNNQRSVPFAYVVSCGNQAQLEIADYVDVLVDDPRVGAIGLYVEGLRDVPRFAAVALRALAAGKPIVAFKLGTSPIAARLAESHTSSLAGADELYQALFDRVGIARVRSPAALLESLKMLTVADPPKGNRLAVFTCSGGDSGTAADMAEPLGIALPQPSPRQHATLRSLLPDFATINNPLDYNTSLWGNEEALTEVFGAMLSEGYDGALLVIDYPRPGAMPGHGGCDRAVQALINASRAARIPAAICSVFSESVPEDQRQWMIGEGIAPLQGIENGLQAVAAAMTVATNRERLAGSGAIAALPPVPPRPGAPALLDEWESKRLLAHHGVPVPAGRVVPPGEAPAAAAALGYPVAVKAISRDLPHKTEAGAVALGLTDAGAVAAAVAAMDAAIARHRPGLVVERALVEPMVEGALAELLVGVKRDEQFGLALVIGAGGTLVELVRDTRTLLLPTDEDEIAAALKGLRVARLLSGFRGRPAADMEKVVAAIVAVARFAEAHRDSLVELDVNPLMVTPNRVVAVDALVRMAPPTGDNP
jgi:acyl-CoA synthetase (NDP forming)